VRSAAGTVPEQWARGALRPARARRADSRGDATEKKQRRNGENEHRLTRHTMKHQTGRAPETARTLTAGMGGHSPPHGV